MQRIELDRAGSPLTETPGLGRNLEDLPQGGPAGPLGFPTTDESEVAGGPSVARGGWISEFEHGYIFWLN